MSIFNNQVSLISSSDDHYVIKFNEEILESVKFSFILPEDGCWMKVNACVNGLNRDIYLDKDCSFIQDRLKLEELVYEGVFKDLGITKEEYETNRLSAASRVFRGHNLKEQTSCYLSFLEKSESFKKKEVLKNLIKEYAIFSINNYACDLRDAPIELKNDRDVVLAALNKNKYSIKHASDELKNDENFILEVVNQIPSIIENLSETFRDNKTIMLSAVSKNSWALKHASSRLKNDEEVVLVALNENRTAIFYASIELKNNRDFIFKLAKKGFLDLSLISDEFKNDIEIVLEVVKKNKIFFQYASNELKDNKEFVLKLADECSLDLCFVSDRLKNDKDVVLAAVKQYKEVIYKNEDCLDNYYEDDCIYNYTKFIPDLLNQDFLIFRHASDELKNDREFVLTIVSESLPSLEYASLDLKNDKTFILEIMAKTDNALAIKYAHNSLRDNKELMLEVVNKDGVFLQYASDRLKNDEELALASIKQNSSSFNYVSEFLKKDESFQLKALHQNAHSIEFVSDFFRNDKKLVLELISKNPFILNLLPDWLKEDRDVVLVAVSNNAYSLQYVSDRLKDDKGIVIAAVNRVGDAIKYASFGLKNDKDVVMTAVSKKGKALEYASDFMKNDKDVVMAAVNQNILSIEYASNFLQNDKEFLMLLSIRCSFNLILNLVSPEIDKISSISIEQKEEIIREGKKLKRGKIFSVGVDKVMTLVKGYENFKNNQYVNNDTADKYVKIIMSDNQSKLNKVVNHIEDQIFKDKSIVNKEKFFSDTLIHLAVEADCLKVFGLTDPKILRIILPLVKEIMNHKNKEIKIYLLFLIKTLSTESLKIFIKNLVAISGGKVNLILPSIILSKLNINSSIQIELKKVLLSKNKILKNQISQFFKSVISLEKKLINKIPFISHEKIAFIMIKLLKNQVVDNTMVFDEVDQFLLRASLIDIILNVNYADIVEIDDFSFLNLFNLVINKLFELSLLEDKKEIKEKFIMYFVRSRVPHAIFSYVSKFSNDEEIIPVIKNFIDGVLNDSYLEDRHLNNSHKHLLTESQKLTWEAGADRKLDQFFMKEYAFDPVKFLTNKLVNYGHGGNKLNRIVRMLDSKEIITSPNLVEISCIDLLTNTDLSKQLDLLKKLKSALDSSPYYEGIQFKKDIKDQIELIEKPFYTSGELKIKDTEDWQDLFFCGTEVIGSCQRVDGDPDYNKCLLGYVLDGKIRMIKIYENNYATIARSIIKIMKDPSGKPALFLEESYPDDRYYHFIREFAKQRAKDLEMNLYEYDSDEKLFELESEGNIAPYEYEDADCGVVPGVYKVFAKLVDI